MYRTIGDVPFLNGGLFEETDLDKRQDIAVPDKTIGGILRDLFERFNFTVMESTPYDIEVAVDPEMLGKVFEELVTGRHDSGAYYTPRPVVSFMCREALKGYLEGKEIGLDADAVARFVDERDTSGISLTAAPDLSKALSAVTVVDPACGSGAYLLGMMQELIELQTILYNIGVDSKKIYDLKLEIIQRNLYGVDIDEFAVNIAMLRMWLSLAIDFEGGKPDPLPNLDFKVLCGDSLLGPDPSASIEVQGTLGQDLDQFRRLGQLKAEYMRASLETVKDQLRSQIEELTGQIRQAMNVAAMYGVVDWRVEFAEVFAEQGGFDIAIANPPYIQLQKDGGKLANLYRDAGYETLAPRGDIYQLFYERGCQLLMPSHGLLAYITSNSWLKAEYGKSTRRYFAGNHTPRLLLELGKDVFESAIVDSGVLMLGTGGAACPFPAVDMDRVGAQDFPPDAHLWGQARPDGDAPWSIMSPFEYSIVEKMQSKGMPLKEWGVSLNLGIKTGFDKALIIDDKTKQMLVAGDPDSGTLFKQVVKGADIKRYKARWAGEWLIDTHNGYGQVPAVNIDDYPLVKAHLDGFLTRLEKRHDKGKTPYNLRNCAYHDNFLEEKLFWMDLTGDGRFSYDSDGMFCLNSAYILCGKSLKFLCAVLNARLATWYMRTIALTSGMGVHRWFISSVERIPIPTISAAKQRPFVRLVDQILKDKAADPNADTRHLEWEIDRLVYDLYGLTEEENTAIERSLGLIHASDEEEDAGLSRAVAEGRTGELVSREEVMTILRAPDGD